MNLSILCASIFALLFGAFICFGGYRFFLVLLPIIGFFVGFTIGAQAVQSLFGTAFLASVTSWVVGFFVALLFALLSYLFYIAGVLLIAGALGYAIGTGIMMAIGFDMGLITWLVGVVLAVVVAGATLMLNVQKYVVVTATAVLGAAVIVGTFLLGPQAIQFAQFFQNPVRQMLSGSPFMTIIFLILVGAGIVWQLATTRSYLVEAYPDRI